MSYKNPLKILLIQFCALYRIAFGIETETQLAFDVSIFDRIHALFSSPFATIASRDAASSDQENLNELSPNSQRIVQSKSEIKIVADCLKFILV